MHDNFFHKLKVYYEDTDSGGVVYYANYLKFLERARTEALYSIGYSNKKVKDDFESLIIVKSCNIEYKKSAYLEDELTIRSFVKSISKTSFSMNQIITRGDDKIVDQDGNGLIDANDRTFIGNPNPEFIYGINLNFRYKRFNTCYNF